jgi:hypothetical protein
MAKADIGNHRGHGFRSGLLFIQFDHSTRVTIAEPVSQFLASGWTIRNQKDRVVAGHGCCTGLAEGFQIELGPNPILAETYQYLVKR